MKITFIRHSEVQERYHNCYNGHIDIELSKNGIDKSIALAEKIRDEKYDLIYCSDLKRAKQTLKYLDRKEKVIYTNKLREKSWGKDEGLSYKEIIKRENIEYENFSQWINYLDGEDIDSFTNKIKRFFLDYILKQSHTNILIVTHSGVIKSFIKIINNLELEDAFKIKINYSSLTLYDSKANIFVF